MRQLDRKPGTSEQLITFVKDRAGHDLRYAIDSSRIREELGWKPSLTFEEGLTRTVDWYLENQEWMKRITSGAYQSYYKAQYRWIADYSTVTDLARFLGWSTLQPRITAM